MAGPGFSTLRGLRLACARLGKQGINRTGQWYLDGQDAQQVDLKAVPQWFATTLHAAGLPVVVGGAGHFVPAWERLLDEMRVQVHTGRWVERIVLRHGAAAGVAGEGPACGAGRTGALV
jgi:phytoene dehydrogenase-like protein